MNLTICTLIIGAGYSGILTQRRLAEAGITSIIVDQGSDIQFNDKDFVVICREQQEYTCEHPIQMESKYIWSGSEPFIDEYSLKLYGKRLPLTLGDGQTESVYVIDNDKVLGDVKSYGNVTINRIDMHKKLVEGYVAHSKKKVTIRYNKLVSTLPLYEFAKFTGIDLLADYDIFISFFPIGIVKKVSHDFCESIIMEYYSDRSVPFYRKHFHGNTVFYEYCLNRPMNIKFNRVAAPGRIQKIDPKILNAFYVRMLNYDIHFVGRFARWDPDFRIDHIYSPKKDSSLNVLFS